MLVLLASSRVRLKKRFSLLVRDVESAPPLVERSAQFSVSLARVADGIMLFCEHEIILWLFNRFGGLDFARFMGMMLVVPAVVVVCDDGVMVVLFVSTVLFRVEEGCWKK